MSSTRRRCVAVGSVAAAVIAGLGVQPALSSPGPGAAAVEPGGSPAVAADSATAQATAKTTGERVEDRSQGDGYNVVFAEPDGTWTAETSSEPIRARNQSGDWAPIDLTLVQRNGRLEPKNAAADVSLSAGEDRTFAKVTPTNEADTQAGAMTWSWATELSEPRVDGATATYVDAVPGGGDLVVTATATGFTHNVVLHEPPSSDARPVQFVVPVATPDAEIRETSDGALVIKSNDAGHETLASAAAPVMWDASSTSASSPDPTVEAVDAHVIDTSAGGKVVLTPDADFLSDPDTVYPVTIDPTISVNTTADTWVMNAGYTSSQSSSLELRAGTYDDGTHRARTFLRFPGYSVWGGKTILAAAFSMRNFSSGSCNAGAIRASRITESWDANTLTWANQPSATSADAGQQSTAFGYDSSCPADDASFSITEMVRTWAKGAAASDGAPNYGVRLSAVTETNPNSWRRYRATEWTTESQRPVLKVNYNTPPGTAYAPSASPLAASSPDGSTTVYTTSTRTPFVSALAPDDDGDQVQLLIRAYAADDLNSTVLGRCITEPGAADARLGCTISQLPDNRTVYLRAKAVDQNGSWGGGYSSSPSGWTSWRPIVVNTPQVFSPTVLQIVALDPGSTAEDVTANVEEFLAAAAAESPEMTFEQAAQAILSSMEENADLVEEQFEEAQEVVAGVAEPETPEIVHPGTDEVEETVPEGAHMPTEAELTGEPPMAYAMSGDTSSASGKFIHLPKAKRYGDIAISPNKGAYGVPHGHAAIFTGFNWIAQAPGGDRRVEVVHRLSRYGQSFVPGTQMMSVYTDEGKGPLLSYEKREKALNWAKSRQGDRYRGWSSPNSFRVTAAVGSDKAKQNCSQLVWGAYNYANGYNFNPVELASHAHPALLVADEEYVTPGEIAQAKQTVRWRTVYTDSTN